MGEDSRIESYSSSQTSSHKLCNVIINGDFECSSKFFDCCIFCILMLSEEIKSRIVHDCFMRDRWNKDLNRSKCRLILLGSFDCFAPSRFAIRTRLRLKNGFITLHFIHKCNQMNKELLFHPLSSGHLSSSELRSVYHGGGGFGGCYGQCYKWHMV